MAVIKRILPFMQSPNFQDSQNLGGADDGHKQRRQGRPPPQYHVEGSARTPGRSSRATSGFSVAILQHVFRKK